MFRAKNASDGRDDKAEVDESGQSFHDVLLVRSQSCLVPRRRGIAAKLAAWRTWVGKGARLPDWVAESVIFAGGVAFGAGVILLRRDGSTSLRGQAAVALGLGFVVITVLLRSLSRVGSRSWTPVVRTE